MYYHFGCHVVKFNHSNSNFTPIIGWSLSACSVPFMFSVSQAWLPHAYTVRHCYSFCPFLEREPLTVFLSKRLCSLWICKSVQVHSAQQKLQVSIAAKRVLQYYTDAKLATICNVKPQCSIIPPKHCIKWYGCYSWWFRASWFELNQIITYRNTIVHSCFCAVAMRPTVSYLTRWDTTWWGHSCLVLLGFQFYWRKMLTKALTSMITISKVIWDTPHSFCRILPNMSSFQNCRS